MTDPQAPNPAAARRSGRRTLLWVFLACAAPVLASYFTYYVIRPDGRTNYGELIEPQRPLASLAVTDAEGKAQTLEVARGRWLLVVVADGACEAACAQRLWVIRQLRLTTGKDRERVDRVLLRSQAGDTLAPPTPLEGALATEHEGLRLLGARSADLEGAMPVATGARPQDHIYVIDPLGNLMMRFPVDADPNRMKKDLAKLLRASRMG